MLTFLPRNSICPQGGVSNLTNMTLPRFPISVIFVYSGGSNKYELNGLRSKIYSTDGEHGRADSQMTRATRRRSNSEQQESNQRSSKPSDHFWSPKKVGGNRRRQLKQERDAMSVEKISADDLLLWNSTCQSHPAEKETHQQQTSRKQLR
ncbi:hypothetical protein CRENBAI_004156 [Crenichthys baileyi]|uniref:Uncharacterized protein n=1 Tax=Crenichthys baileyi TaxID=28760 RepID=A0AAV9S880_9TELE